MQSIETKMRQLTSMTPMDEYQPTESQRAGMNRFCPPSQQPLLIRVRRTGQPQRNHAAAGDTKHWQGPPELAGEWEAIEADSVSPFPPPAGGASAAGSVSTSSQPSRALSTTVASPPSAP